MAGDNTYTYSTAVAPADQTFTYNTEFAAKPDAYTYSTAVEPQDGTYTYLTAPQAAAPDEYTYSTNAGGPALYTYNAAPEGGGLATYNAQEVGAQGSVINGYVQGDKPEMWYNVPIGEIHPLDTAGRWDSGQVTSINPDSTARASAPLTLTGERADGTVASEDSTRPPTTIQHAYSELCWRTSSQPAASSSASTAVCSSRDTAVSASAAAFTRSTSFDWSAAVFMIASLSIERASPEPTP